MIGSIVATFEAEDAVIQTAIKLLSADESIEVGELVGRRLPMTIEAGDPESLEQLTRQIQKIDGVMNVDVVFVGLDDDQSNESGSI